MCILLIFFYSEYTILSADYLFLHICRCSNLVSGILPAMYVHLNGLNAKSLLSHIVNKLQNRKLCTCSLYIYEITQIDTHTYKIVYRCIKLYYMYNMCMK